jgi:hypothetical protein
MGDSLSSTLWDVHVYRDNQLCIDIYWLLADDNNTTACNNYKHTNSTHATYFYHSIFLHNPELDLIENMSLSILL